MQLKPTKLLGEDKGKREENIMIKNIMILHAYFLENFGTSRLVN